MNLQSIRKVDHADFVMGVAGELAAGEPTFVHRRVDPRKSHPLLPKQVIEGVGELHGKKFAQFHFTALERHFGWREQEHLRYDDHETNTVRWSNEVVALIRRTSAADYAQACQAYGQFRETQKRRNRAKGTV